MYRFPRWFVLVLALMLIGCGSAATPDVPGPTEASPATAATITGASTATVATLTTEDTDAYPGPMAGGYPAPDVYNPYPESASPAAPGAMFDPYAEPDDGGSVSPTSWAADGVITQGEYAHQTDIGSVTVFWSNDQEYLYIAAEAQSTGWLSIGIDPDDRMLGADFLIAAEAGGPMAVYDSVGQGRTGPTHPLDTDEGGTSDIVASAVVQEGGWTRFEVQRPLVSGDTFDKPLSPGATYPIIVATGSATGFSAPHSFRDSGEITLD